MNAKLKMNMKLSIITITALSLLALKPFLNSPLPAVKSQSAKP